MIRAWAALCLGGLLSIGLLSCSPSPPFGGASPARFDPASYPQKLSAWRLLDNDGRWLTLNPQALAYGINMPLFSDYAAKYRSLWLPDNSQGTMQADRSLALPVGTLISKTFFYPNGYAEPTTPSHFSGTRIPVSWAKLIETRILVRQQTGWDALTYRWQGEDAELITTGGVVTVAQTASGEQAFPYVIPTRNECASCHALDHRSGKLQPIGLKPEQLTASDNKAQTTSLQRIIERGWLAPSTQAPEPYALWGADAHGGEQLNQQARDYLDSNCAHCHSPKGPAKNSALNLQRGNTERRRLGLCKPPIAAGKGSGNRLYSIVPGEPSESILSYRLRANDPSRRMPEIGRSLTHLQGAALVDAWIGSLPGTCR